MAEKRWLYPRSDEWKRIEEDDTDTIRKIFDNDFPKNDVKAVLIREQRGLCAYCMRRIRMDIHSRVEHLVALSIDKKKAIDHNNMPGVCDGGEKIMGQQGHILCCDAHKKEKRIIDNLLNKKEREEYAGVKFYYFKKKYNSLVRRGL